MCGIVGFVGKRQASGVLLEGLKRLEYRGYDSAGLAVRDGEKKAQLVKAKGRLQALVEKTDAGKTLQGDCGIGHTRWATHGEPSEQNAHPHASNDFSVIAVHNGIIENHLEIRNQLQKHGYIFHSQTDTEAAVNLIDEYLKKCNDPIHALSQFMLRVRGSYALAVLFSDYPNEIFVARKDSPMILGKGKDGTYLASDIPALLPFTRSVYYIDNLQIARLSENEVHFYNIDREEITLPLQTVSWDTQAAEKAGFEHFMMKEIHEQPQAVENTLCSLIKEGEITLPFVGLDEKTLKSFDKVSIVGCGSAYHVGVVLSYVIEDLARIPTRVEIASEFRYKNPIVDNKTLVVVISQSGETADTLAALRTAKEKGAITLAIVNVVGSSIAREAEHTLYTLAGPEIAVATTKAYSTQLAAGYALTLLLAKTQERIEKDEYKRLIGELLSLPKKIQEILEDKHRLQWFAAKFSTAKDVFFIGRGVDYAACLEGSLKMKEISYIHSEAYAAGELKHGTISLVEEGTLVIGLLTQSRLFEKTEGSMYEVKSRGAYLMGLTTYGNYAVEETADFTVYVPPIDEHFSASLSVVPLQLLGYYISVARGLDVDKPRNLAKSVTVE